jgi:hypothetical protein
MRIYFCELGSPDGVPVRVVASEGRPIVLADASGCVVQDEYGEPLTYPTRDAAESAMRAFVDERN